MTTVALVAAKDAATSIGATVRALGALPGVDEVWVVDDGSSDDTATRAADAGAEVVRLVTNRGKGGALAAGAAATPHADRYLLADADLRDTASGLAPLLEENDALVVGVLPSAEGRGGFGSVVRLARSGITRACGLTMRAPLSGQRVIDGPTLRSLVLAPRFGVEVGMTIDVVRSGGDVREVPVAVDHDHRGRSWRGFLHRGRQGVDVAGALLPRLTSTRQRIASVALVALLVLGVLSGLSLVAQPDRGDRFPRQTKVVLVAIDRLGLADLNAADMPVLRDTAAAGVTGALNVRTTDRRSLDQRGGEERPSKLDAFASLGASARVRAPAALATVKIDGDGFRDPLRVPAVAEARRLARRDNAAGLPGALGDALHAAGLRTGVVTLGDDTAAAAALMDARGQVDVADPSIAVAAEAADVLLIDAGADRRVADEALSFVLGNLWRSGTAVVIFSPTPPGAEWAFTPVVIYAGAGTGSIASSSTRRDDLGVLSDLAPTTLGLLGLKVPASMTGAELRAAADAPNVAALTRFERDGAIRLRFFLPAAVAYTFAALAFYLLVIATLVRQRPTPRRGLRVGSSVAAAFPLAILVNGATQHWLGWGGESPLFVAVVCVVLGGAAAGLRGLRPVYALAAATAGIIACDVAVTGPIHASSILGYSLETTGRFYGLPNASFSVFAASVVLLAAWAAGSEQRGTVVRAAAAIGTLGVGLAVVGAPWLGNDVGGLVALLPIVAATAWWLAGRRLTVKVVAAGAVLSAVAFGVVALAETTVGESSHLARAVSNNASLGSTLSRRVEANWGLLIDQPWGFPTFALAGFAIWVLARNWWPDYLASDAPLRRAGIAICAASLAAFVVNDSGPVVTVLCLVVLAPAFSLLGLSEPARETRRGRAESP